MKPEVRGIDSTAVPVFLPAVACQLSLQFVPANERSLQWFSVSKRQKHMSCSETQSNSWYWASREIFSSLCFWRVRSFSALYNHPTCSVHTVLELILQDPVYTKIEEWESDYYLINRCSTTYYFPKPRLSGRTTFGMTWRLEAEVSSPLSRWKCTCRSIFGACLPYYMSMRESRA